MSSLHFVFSLSLSRTDALLIKLSLLVGQQVFYGALWGSMVVSPSVRLPASVFIVTHFDRMASLRQQAHMLGYDHGLVVRVCHKVYYSVYDALPSFSFLSDWNLDSCVCPGQVSVSLSARLKHPGAEEHARNPALLFPLCHMLGRFTHSTGVKGEGFWETELKWPLKRACYYFSGLRPNKTLRKSIYLRLFRTQQRPVLLWVSTIWPQWCLRLHSHCSAETCPWTDASTPGS